MTALLSRIFSSSEKSLPDAVKRYRESCRLLYTGKAIEKTDFVAFDTELTGLDFKKDSIISIGAVKLTGSQIMPGQTFYRLVRPESELNKKSVVVHELTHTELAGAEKLSKVMEEFLEFAGGAVLLGHFVNIDVHFVNRALKRHFGTSLDSHCVDTSSLHDWLYENDSDLARHYGGMTLKNDLFSMARKYGVTVRKSHNAFDDAYITAQLFQRFLHFLAGCGVLKLNELLSVGKP